MKFTKHLSLGIVLLTGALNADGAIFWVGDTPQCNQSNHYDTLNLALLQAAINGSEADEILSVSFFHNANQQCSRPIVGFDDLKQVCFEPFEGKVVLTLYPYC